ncbi:hypothetical protein IJI72_01670 [Candidatus Saccharibacteria bacterium]|nr:hypothetical protein [Candidatus Saccharibacteria bacterium]
MSENNSPSVRYMDFVGRRRASSTDPLVGRPRAKAPVVRTKAEVLATRARTSAPAVSTDTKTPVVRAESRAPVVKTQPKAPVKPVATARAVPVQKSAERELVARKPEKVTKELYPTIGKPVAKPVAPKKTGTEAPSSSPFLKDYSIDKRPLSSSVPEKKREGEFEKLSFLGVSGAKKAGTQATEETEEEITSGSLRRSRKNVYECKKKDKEEKSKEKKPVKIVDDTEMKGGMPLFVVILVTVLLGAAVGAGLYFLLPK